MYEFTSRVRYSEIGPDGRMTLRGIVTRMQDCAVFHSEAIGRGPAFWDGHKKAWMIISWQILIRQRPAFDHRVTTRTSTYRFRGFLGDRNFVMTDEADGTILAEANSQWAYMDLAAQKPIRVPEEEIQGYGIEPEVCIPDKAPRRIPIPADGTPGIVREDKPSFEIESSRIDTNHHVNNLAYIDMADDYLPEGTKVRELRVEYIRQMRLGDVACPVTYSAADYFQVCINNQAGEPCAIVRFMV